MNTMSRNELVAARYYIIGPRQGSIDDATLVHTQPNHQAPHYHTNCGVVLAGR